MAISAADRGMATQPTRPKQLVHGEQYEHPNELNTEALDGRSELDATGDNRRGKIRLIIKREKFGGVKDPRWQQIERKHLSAEQRFDRHR